MGTGRPHRLSRFRPPGSGGYGAPHDDLSHRQRGLRGPPRFAEALRELGLGDVAYQVRRFPDATRTAAEAAAAIGCELSQICKSLIFAADGVPVLVLMDGASRVDLDRVREELGAGKVTRAKADVVRETTGYAIGGVPLRPPHPHPRPRRPLPPRPPGRMGRGRHPYTVFPMPPKDLITHAGATLVDVRDREV